MGVIEKAKSSLVDGDRAPFCCGMTRDNSFYSFEAQAGRAAIVILAGLLPPSATAPVLQALQQHYDEFSRLGADILVLVDGQSDHALDYASWSSPGAQVVYCLGEFFRHCGFADLRPSLFIMDRNQRVITSIDPQDETGFAAAALACLAALLTEEPRTIALPAPVLLIPNIFTADFCRRLIEHFETSAHVPGGMASIDKTGNAVHKIDPDKKMRQDCILAPGESLYGPVLNALARICLPEMQKAFQFEACHTDRILLARYDDTGGYFRRHRDNVAQSVAFRQFALSVNLNMDEYEGGYLTFPEYNGHLYRPGRGAGIIFSASLLHEATAVTRGRRYVLLTFFHNAAAQARRLAAMAEAGA
jgi:predicted 2-oxoglutarate/Fe(II)-dependent dioxygenase YbiX